jgi:hypothetical protein
LSRRRLLAALAVSAASAGRLPASEPRRKEHEFFFLTRGIVLVVQDLRTLDWPRRAARAGLTTIATHIFPHEVASFLKTDAGHAFLEGCRTEGLHVEHELHAMSDLLPRPLFDKDPTMFPMNDQGQRVRAFNLCVHSKNALDIACENAVQYARQLRPTTGRYFYWIDDGQPMCRCPKCREYSDSDQALLLENRLLDALRRDDPRATLAHLAYARTLRPPSQIKPDPGIFLEFAPITRRYDRPLGDREVRPGNGPSHGELLDLLDANLAVFGRQGAQVLEYWLDLSRFSGWRREKVQKLPWNREVFLADLRTYAQRGIRHATTFGAWLDGDYVKRFGEPPIDEYAAGLRRWKATGQGGHQGIEAPG